MARFVDRGPAHCAAHSAGVHCPSDCPDRLGPVRPPDSLEVRNTDRNTAELDDVRPPDSQHRALDAFGELADPAAAGTMDEDDEIAEIVADIERE